MEMGDDHHISNKIYVQKKNRFEPVPRPGYGENYTETDQEDTEKGDCLDAFYPIMISAFYQKCWTKLAIICHGLLGGLALSHALYVGVCFQKEEPDSFVQYGAYSDVYFGIFFGLCVLCIVSVLDRVDVGHMMSKDYLSELWRHKFASFALIVYLACFVLHLCTAQYDEKLALLAIPEESNTTDAYYRDLSNPSRMTKEDLRDWMSLSLSRSVLAMVAWLCIGLGPQEDMLHFHLKNLESYLPHFEPDVDPYPDTVSRY
nr:unnamed protein product [Callosobruchus analis]